MRSPRQAAPRLPLSLSLAESELSCASNSQASLADSTLSPAESEIFHAGSSQAGSSQSSLEDSTLSQAESALSQAGSSQASLADSTLSMAESEISQSGNSQVSQASQEDNTLSPTESELSQASSPSSLEEGTPQAESSSPPQAVRCSARLRARQAGTFPREVSEVSKGDSTVPKRVLPQDSASQEARSSPIGIAPHRVLPPQEEPNPKWVINLSSKPLTPAQRSLLAKGPNFAVTPRHPPNLEYITAIEAACTKLSQQDAEELRADINWVLRSSHPPKSNLTKAQNSALRELKRDRDHIVLTADKGVAMVIMDRKDYISKANNLLGQNTYKTIQWDPTNTIKNKLITIFKRVKKPNRPK